MDAPGIRIVDVNLEQQTQRVIIASGHSGMKSGGFVFISSDGVVGKVIGAVSGWWYELSDLDSDDTDELVVVKGTEYDRHVYWFDSKLGFFYPDTAR